ncbi:vanin-like protein 1 [Malaya genurostris]|uniref:vanin-like protein 1 n=1 Tax=Malaya genurostris TaxID=325434 RepID=UPI0026F3AEAD|nr:vanin-like protein 1 [Malaya genurostris]XP_058463791.1 vanin-like protein 1 [Malaya genurostris]XP_058463792.1 vanin-like protein 1 [Malaya genurostris]
MEIKAAVFYIAYCIVLVQASIPSDDHYWAGVVEFSYKDKDTEDASVNTAKNLERYVQMINSSETDPVDIIVFPEYGLNAIETASFVPGADEKIAPCNNFEYERIVQDLSCVARARRKYLVVNLVEKAVCPEKEDTRRCAADGLYHFNTNVVYDRNGVVIARYRKYNLFGERGINTTTSVETVRFETDFGVLFGTFTCFDLMFDQPALQLIRDGVTDIIFTTMWFSELPFLTAAQIQQAWAFENNVNFLASGASYPEIGSTGTGIFAGKRGRILAIMNHQADVKLYVAKVPKIDRAEAEINRQPVVKYNPSEMKNLKLKRDQLDTYETVNLPLESSNNYTLTLCQTSLCCNFTLNYTVNLPVSNQQFYRYRLAVNNGARTFDGFADGFITACAIFACTGDNLETCGARFENSNTTVNAIQFNSIDLHGVFPGDDEVFLMPNSVDMSILPLEVDEFQYSERKFLEDTKTFKEIRHTLISPRSDLFTFAIWGRQFVSTSSGVVLQNTLVLFVTIFSILFVKLAF